MTRKPLIAGNWKMHMTVSESVALAEAVVQASAGRDDREVMIAPPFTALAAVGKTLAGTKVKLGSQNVCWEEKGAFTGEISPVMLQDVGCSMAIIGHSERRHIFGENDAMANKRIAGAKQFGIIPILCIGEILEEREGGRTMSVLEKQLRSGLDNIELNSADDLVVAYEPVWAIGTGKTASPEQAQETHAFVRGILASIYEKNIASEIRILYGGSVNPDNVDTLIHQDDVDGALVGGAALKADSFQRIIRFN